jgi:tetratricopeptide (TPR) repeat protein
MQMRADLDHPPEWFLLRIGIGCLVGTCLGLLAAGVFVARRTVFLREAARATSAAGAILTTTKNAELWAQEVTPTPRNPVLRAAEHYLGDWQPQAALDLLLPLRDSVLDPVELARVYDDLGQAELELGHTRVAAVYFRHAFSLIPTADRLFLLAQASDYGGDLEHALGYYQRLVTWEGPEAAEYQETAQDRIRYIILLIGTPTQTPPPTHTSTPLPATPNRATRMANVTLIPSCTVRPSR